VSDRPAQLWIYDRKSDDFSGYKLALDRQPYDVVMYDARRQLSLICESACMRHTFFIVTLILLFNLSNDDFYNEKNSRLLSWAVNILALGVSAP